MMRWLLQICLVVVALVGSADESFAGSNLPKCPTSGYFHNCFGTETARNGNKYVGEFLNGKKHGQGTFTFISGSIYVGEFRNGMKNGQGILTYPDGRVKEGIWKNERFKYLRKNPNILVKPSPPKNTIIKPLSSLI